MGLIRMGLTSEQKRTVVVLLAGALLVVLNQTLLSPALPVIMGDMSVDATTVQWLTSGYSLVEAIIIPLSAYLMGRFGTRRLFVGGLCIFAAGTVLAACAPLFIFLLLGRMLQASATGFVMPMVFTVMLLIFPREKRGAAMGLVSLVIGFAPAVGPSVSGVLVETIGWRALFVVVAVIAALIVIGAFASLKDRGDFERTTFDKASVLLSSFGLLSLLYGLSSITSSENVALNLAMIAAGAVLMFFFVRRQTKLPVPFLRVQVLKTRNYRTTVTIVACFQAGLVGTGVLLPIFLQNLLGATPLQTGLIMLPGAVIGAITAMLAGRLFDKLGVRRLTVPGTLIACVGAAGLVAFNLGTPLPFVVCVYTLLALGLEFTMTPLNTWGVNSLPNSVIQHAQGVSNTLNQVAASMGTAVLVSISALAPAVAPDAPALEQSYLGDHMAFITTFTLMCVAALIILFFVRDKARAAGAVAATAAERGQEPVDYAAGFDGVTVDAIEGDALDPDHTYTAAEVMNREPVCARDTAAMAEVIRLMDANQTSGLPVVNAAGDLVGFVSDGDVASYLGKTEIALLDSTLLNGYRYIDDETEASRLRDLLALNVMAVATKRVISVDAATPVDEVCSLFAAKRIKKVPVVQDGKLVGTLSRRNIMRSLVEAIDALEK